MTTYPDQTKHPSKPVRSHLQGGFDLTSFPLTQLCYKGGKKGAKGVEATLQVAQNRLVRHRLT